LLRTLVVNQILAAALGVNLDGVCLVVALTVRCFLVASLGAFLACCLAVFLINFGAIFLVFVGWANGFLVAGVVTFLVGLILALGCLIASFR
jgi:hypothetical protein